MTDAQIVLTPHQQNAIDWLMDHIVIDELPLVAVRGLAGTGKTSIIPHLREALKTRDIQTCVGSPTHRAAMILRRKGIDAETVHSLALTPYFRADYRRAMAWLGEDVPGKPDDAEQPHEDV